MKKPTAAYTGFTYVPLNTTIGGVINTTNPLLTTTNLFPWTTPEAPYTPYPAACHACGATGGAIHLQVEGRAAATYDPLSSGAVWITYCDWECLRFELAPWRVEGSGTPGKISKEEGGRVNLRELLELE